MAKISLGIGTKLSALVLSSLLLSGCYKIEIKETLNLDGTSELAFKMDMTGLYNTMSSITDTMQVDIEGTGTLTEVSEEETTNEITYESCNDPKLLAKYGAEKLDGPEKIVTVLDLEKETSCAVSETEGMIDITIEDTDKKTGEIVFTQTIERKADTCNDPAIKAFYQVTDFSEPITEEYKLTKTVDISCSDSKKEILVNTITVFENQEGSSETVTEYFQKPEPEVIPETTLTELDALTKTPEEIAAEEAAENIDVCTELDQHPDEIPFFFTKCENIASGIGIFHYSKYDTTSFKINANKTVTYNLQPVADPANENLKSGINSNTGDDSVPMNMDPSLMGIEMDYVLVSPWPILEHSAGELEDANTLRINLLKLEKETPLTVTLDTDGSTLSLVSVGTQLQIDRLMVSLEEKLTASNAPVEKQVEYIYHLSNKIQQLAEIKPSQQVSLGYLQTQLIKLANDLQLDPLVELEAEFLKELDAFGEEVLTSQEELIEAEEAKLEESETQASTEVETDTSVTIEEETQNTSSEEESNTSLQSEAIVEEEEEETTVIEEESPSEAVVEEEDQDEDEEESFDEDEDEEESFEEEEEELLDQGIVLE